MDSTYWILTTFENKLRLYSTFTDGSSCRDSLHNVVKHLFLEYLHCIRYSKSSGEDLNVLGTGCIGYVQILHQFA